MKKFWWYVDFNQIRIMNNYNVCYHLVYFSHIFCCWKWIHDVFKYLSLALFIRFMIMNFFLIKKPHISRFSHLFVRFTKVLERKIGFIFWNTHKDLKLICWLLDIWYLNSLILSTTLDLWISNWVNTRVRSFLKFKRCDESFCIANTLFILYILHFCWFSFRIQLKKRKVKHSVVSVAQVDLLLWLFLYQKLVLLKWNLFLLQWKSIMLVTWKLTVSKPVYLE